MEVNLHDCTVLLTTVLACLQDMRTYIAVNTSYVLLEKPVAYTDTDMWRAWRDDNETWATYWCEPWDPRVALTPFLAHRVTLSPPPPPPPGALGVRPLADCLSNLMVLKICQPISLSAMSHAEHCSSTSMAVSEATVLSLVCMHHV